MKKVQEKEAGNLRRINSKAPEKDLILEAAGILKSGGAIIFPTLALYGLGANALDSKAVQRVFEIKNRPLNKPLLVLVQNMEGLRALVKSVPEAAEKLMKQFWPGNVTLVFEARDTVCEILCAGTGKIGIRMPQHPVAKALCRATGTPITATSANLSGDSGYESINLMPPSLVSQVDVILDAGTLAGGLGSTVVDVTLDPPRILREGNTHSERIWAALGKPSARP